MFAELLFYKTNNGFTFLPKICIYLKPEISTLSNYHRKTPCISWKGNWIITLSWCLFVSLIGVLGLTVMDVKVIFNFYSLSLSFIG